MIKVLFVDDEVRVLDALRRMLRSKRDEWDCHFIESVDEAMNHLIVEGTDAIVSDINMPNKTGFDFLKAVRSHPKFSYIPFIMLTGNSDMSVKREALNMGVTDFVNKPCDFIELTARISNAVRMKHYQDQICEYSNTLETKVKERTEQLEVSRREIVYRLAKAAEAKDATTGGHIVRVGLMSRLIAREMGLSESIQERLLLSSPLHDLGKIGIADGILNKPGKLNDEEREQMKKHCEVGAEILASELNPIFSGGSNQVADDGLMLTAARIALCHHERWDGNGYPVGLKGDSIPLEARIVAIADVYDALRSTRPYKPAYSREQAWGILQEESGKHFDPAVVDAMGRCLEEVEKILAAGDPIEQIRSAA